MVKIDEVVSNYKILETFLDILGKIDYVLNDKTENKLLEDRLYGILVIYRNLIHFDIIIEDFM